MLIYQRSGGSGLHKTLVIAKEYQSDANLFCNGVGAEGDTFTAQLYTNGVHTHFWAGWLMTEPQFEAVSKNDNIQIFNSPEEALQTLGLKRSENIEI